MGGYYTKICASRKSRVLNKKQDENENRNK